MSKHNHQEFVDWLEHEIWKKRVTYSEVARRGGISHSRISQVLGGETPGWEFVAAVARALEQPLDLVAKKAGLWEGGPDAVQIEKGEYVNLFLGLPEHQRDLVLVQMRAWDLYGRRREQRRDR